jgi:hypothetical protein
LFRFVSDRFGVNKNNFPDEWSEFYKIVKGHNESAGGLWLDLDELSLKYGPGREGKVRRFLVSSDDSWPVGLQKRVVASLGEISRRYFICDNSAALGEATGRKCVKNEDGTYTYVCVIYYTGIYI